MTVRMPKRAATRDRSGADAKQPAPAPGSMEPVPDARPFKPRQTAPSVGPALKRARTDQNLSLEKLAQKSGVSRAMLGQIELGQSTPTINVLWKVAVALEVPFSSLLQEDENDGFVVLRKERAKVLESADGTFSSRALFPYEYGRNIEFYELRLAPRKNEEAEAHATGTTENLVVTQGTVELRVGERVERLSTGDAIVFVADKPHVYANVSDVEAVMYLVMSYVSPTAGS